MSEAEFAHRRDCYLEHYGEQNVTINGDHVPVNPLLSLGENLSDQGGLKLAKEAYEIWRRKRRHNNGAATASSGAVGGSAEETPLRLDGVVNHLGTPFTADQLFYIAYAQVWCEKYKNDTLLYLLRTDSHLPGEARVRGTVALQRGFREAMGCRPGDKMVAKRSCNIW